MTVATKLRRLERQYGRLLARRSSSLEDYTRYERDPAGFIREVLQGEPWGRQVEVAEAVRDHRQVVVRSANAVGKDWLAARLGLWWVYAHRGTVILSGPTERQVREILMGEVSRAFLGAELPGDLYQTSLRVGEAGILAFTSSDVSRLTGFHAPRLMVVLTEAQGVEDYAWEAALACATGAADRLLAVGNPLRPSGRFHRVSNSPHWVSFAIPASEHPNVVEGRDVIPGGVTRQFVEAIEREYGRDSAVYRARVEAEFPEEDVQGVVRRDWLERAAGLKLRPRGRLLLSVDVARYGPDRSCVVILEPPVVREIVTWGGTSLTETVRRVIRRVGEVRMRRRGDPTIVVDEPGLGGGVIDRLREQRQSVYAFNGARRARKPRRFANCRAEAFWELREALQGERLAVARDERLWEELLALEWTLDSTGRIMLQPKDELRAKLRRSPDRADALAMAAWYEGRRVPALKPSYW